MNRAVTAPVIAFFPEASFGAALNCVAIAQALARRGALPLFLCHPGFTGVFADYGFKEVHLPGPAAPPRAADHWQAFIQRHAAHFDLSALDQLHSYVGPTWEAIVDTVAEAEAGLTATLARLRPDLIVLDNVVMFPAVARGPCPWVRVVSCAETEVPDPAVPPCLSGLAPDDPGCTAFAAAALAATAPAHARYNAFRRDCGLPPLPAGQFLEPSPTLNLLLAPEPVRYRRARPLAPPQWVFLDGCVRQEAPYEVPVLPANDGPLVYLSFGSLGAIDTDLIGRMIRVFATLPARFLVNVGHRIEAYRQVPDNVYLGTWFPQPSVVAQCDLFIHHGGNNSFCEALVCGVPSLVMPYCWDGHDNAQRAAATATGARLDRAHWTDADLRETVQRLLADAPMRARLAQAAARMARHPGPEVAAAAILGCLAGRQAHADGRRLGSTG
ncbi:MAG: nucleotide disphospho-sugar-binding domain-containing protein [Gemmobacter sp.]